MPPVYAPLLLAFAGGGGFGLSIALGGRESIGWFPLGPREVFVPDYRVSERYVTNINVTNTVVSRTNVVNVFNNRNAELGSPGRRDGAVLQSEPAGFWSLSFQPR